MYIILTNFIILCIISHMAFIERTILNTIKNRFEKERIIILVGSRQVGKTFIAKKIFTDIHINQKIFLNCEDPRQLANFENIETFIKYLDFNSMDISKQTFIVIDEFQYIKNATKLLKIIYDLYENVKILATGPSSIEIQKHMKESLTGRKKIYNVYSLSFDEFINFEDKSKKYSNISLENATPQNINSINSTFLYKYLYYGGYPRITAELSTDEEKKEELNEIYTSYLQKDIKSLISGENIIAYNNLLKCIASQIGNLININELSNTTGLTRRQVENYLTILQETFIIKMLPPFYSNKRKEISKMPKLFFSDQGLANFILNDFSEIPLRNNIGNIIENFVFNEIKNSIGAADRIYFWRTLQGSEIDFIIQTGKGLIPIEVKWKMFKTDAASRAAVSIPRSFSSFFELHKNITATIVVTMNYAGKRNVENKEVFFVPAVLIAKFIRSFLMHS